MLRNKLIVATVELAGFLSASSGSVATLHYWAIHHPFSFHGNEKSLENKQFLWFIQKTVWNAHTHTHTFRQMPLSEPISEYTCWMVHASHGFGFAAASDRSRQSVNVALQCDRNGCKAYTILFTPPRPPDSWIVARSYYHVYLITAHRNLHFALQYQTFL